MSLTVTSNMSLFNDCDTVGDWLGGSAVTDIKKEGVGSIGFDLDIETLELYDAITSTDFSDTTFYAWVNVLTAAFLVTWANGGIRMSLYDSSGNISTWYLGGKDTYEGGWRRFTFSTSSTPDSNNGTSATLTDITRVYIGGKALSKSKLSENFHFDYITYHADGTAPIEVTGGASAPRDFDELLSQDDSITAGIIRKDGEAFFTLGAVDFGDVSGALTTVFADSNQIVITENLYRSFTTTLRTSAESLVPAGHFDWTVTEDTSTTSFTLGEKSGTSGINGCTIKNGGNRVLNFSGSGATTMKLYGTSFIDCGTFALPTTSANREVLNCSFSGCGQVTASTCKVENSTFANAPGQAVLIASTSHGVKDCQFIACDVGIEFSVEDTYALVGCTFSGSVTADLENSVSGVAIDSNVSGAIGLVVYVGNNEYTSQSFTGDGSIIGSVEFMLGKNGGPTGSTPFRLYAHSGTFGTSSEPSVAPGVAGLMDSLTTLDVSTLGGAASGTSLPLVYQTVNLTKYCVGLNYSGGDSSNFVRQNYNPSGAHAGNAATGVSSWTPQAAWDLVFWVYDGGVIVNASGGSDPSTWVATGATNPAGIRIVNTVTHTLTGLVNTSEVTYVETTTANELFHVESVTGNQTDYSFNAPLGVNVDIFVDNNAYKRIEIFNLDLGSDDTELPIAQVTDPVYKNP